MALNHFTIYNISTLTLIFLPYNHDDFFLTIITINAILHSLLSLYNYYHFNHYYHLNHKNQKPLTIHDHKRYLNAEFGNTGTLYSF